MAYALGTILVLALGGMVAYILYLRRDRKVLLIEKAQTEALLNDRRARVTKLEESRLKEEKELRHNEESKIPTATAVDGLDKLLKATHSHRP